MNAGELRARLATVPDDVLVLVESGEYGPAVVNGGDGAVHEVWPYNGGMERRDYLERYAPHRMTGAPARAVILEWER